MFGPRILLASLTAFVGLAGLDACSALAQLTIQQPVFGVNSTATTVSVPDRGRALLGGVSRAGESRNSFGPFRSGTNTGMFREGSSTSVSVTIHDFDEMDRMLLGQAASGTSTARSSPRGNDPYQELLARSQRRGVAATDTSGLAPRRGVTGGTPAVASRGESSASVVAGGASASLGDYYFERGRDAEERGAASVAKLHYKLAAKHGSAAATARLASLPIAGSAVATGR